MSSYEGKSHYQNKDIAEKYDSQFRSPLRISNLREKLVGWGEQAAFQRLVSQVPQTGSILDIACGTGRYVEFLLRQGYQVGGVDISPEMLTIAQKRVDRHSNLLFLQKEDAERLPFDDKHFDGVTCMRLYHRVPPPARLQMLREVKRVGRGWAILFFGMSTPWLCIRRAVRSRVFPGRPSNPYPLTLEKVCEELGSVGFTLKDHAWVLPFIAEGMIVLVEW